MPLAAIYARKSTEQNVADEEKSVTRQIDLARAYATKHDFEVRKSTFTSTTRSPGRSSTDGPG